MLDYCLENLVSLVSAEVGFYCSCISSKRCHECLIKKKSCSECLIKVLTGIYNVQSLKLTKRSLQLLTDFPESLEMLSDMFGNLKFLMLNLESPSVDAALNFLDRFSHIENLVWERRPKVIITKTFSG
ncbi:hypothetical protein AQUCO_01400313v1 [Aquilegia coerulea]|uniref:FBD domain-containing protein n=1 Tax=Aquilegia coerulea TaxID=218851 RepID=A0A2G5DVX4_AQUCA|nr:hypothetical protein AQUCO_01400313v1 [Aquilegia coerulea]